MYQPTDDFQNYVCPITSEIMLDPVLTMAGQSYERKAIEEWLENNDTDPLTRQKLPSKALIPNWALKKVISEYLQSTGGNAVISAMQEELVTHQNKVVLAQQTFMAQKQAYEELLQEENIFVKSQISNLSEKPLLKRMEKGSELVEKLTLFQQDILVKQLECSGEVLSETASKIEVDALKKATEQVELLEQKITKLTEQLEEREKEFRNLREENQIQTQQLISDQEFQVYMQKLDIERLKDDLLKAEEKLKESEGVALQLKKKINLEVKELKERAKKYENNNNEKQTESLAKNYHVLQSPIYQPPSPQQQSPRTSRLSISTPKFKNPVNSLKQQKKKKEKSREENQEKERQEEKAKKRDEFVAAILTGNVWLVKSLEAKGASFLYTNKEGIYPLAAAVYSLNFKLVKYIEEKLGGDALKQWKTVEINLLKEKIETSIPTVLPVLPMNATYGDLADWYDNTFSWWKDSYDAKVMELQTFSWAETIGSSRYSKLKNPDVCDVRYSASYVGKRDDGTDVLYAPHPSVHYSAVKSIIEDINKDMDEIENKVIDAKIKPVPHINIRNKF